jgi:pyruvate kinase
MNRIIRYTQENSTVRAQFTDRGEYSMIEAISATIIDLAQKVGARAIVAETQTGVTAIAISAWRSKLPLIIVTPEKRVAQQLALLYSSQTYVRPADKYAATKLSEYLQAEHIFSKGDIVVTASGKYAGTPGGTDTIKVRVLE